MPKISFIVPVYNVEKYLSRCVDSILCQSCKDFELILVDDESPDNCPSICDEYAKKDSRIKVIHQTNSGVSVARNKGLEIAQGEWIAFVDSDDWIHPDYVKVLMNTRTFNADIIQFNYENVGKKKIVNSYNFKDDFFSINNSSKWAEWMNICWSWWMGMCWTRIYKRDLLKRCYISFPPDIKWCEDTVFSFKSLLNATRIKTVKEVLYYYFQNPSSCLNNLDMDKYLSRCNAYSILKQYMGNFGNNYKEPFSITYKLLETKYWLLRKGLYREYREVYPSWNSLQGKWKKYRILEFFANLHLDFMGKPLAKSLDLFNIS